MEPTPYEKIRRGEDVLYFLHVPKTAGTTLYAILDRYFASREICPWSTLAHIAEFPREQWGGYLLYRGHFGYELAEVLDRRPITMTMLRDPLDSAISALHHARRSPGLHREVLRGQEVVDFVRGPDLASVVQGRIRLSLVRDAEHMTDDESVERAVAALDELAFVGITERFSESMALLAHTMGWTPPAEVQALNVRPCSHAALPDDAIEIIRSHVEPEYRVYQHARSSFESRLAAMHRVLLDREHRRRMAREPKRDHAHLRFDDVVPGHGWQGHEDLIGAISVPFRWTGPGTESTLDFSLRTDRDVVLQAHVINAIAPDVLQSLTLRVNDCPVPLQTTHRHGLEVVVQGTIPAQVLARDPELTRLRFCVNATRSKHALDPSDPDDRLLGVCFSQLAMAPVEATGEHREDRWRSCPTPSVGR